MRKPPAHFDTICIYENSDFQEEQIFLHHHHHRRHLKIYWEEKVEEEKERSAWQTKVR